MEKVSIILPVYNAEKTLEICINSILIQTYKNWELIIINDCSNDLSYKLIKKFQIEDNRIKVINNLENCGVSKSRNLGINISKGDFITFIDADDWYEKDAIEKMVYMIKKCDADMLRFSYNVIFSNNIIQKKEYELDYIEEKNNEIKKEKFLINLLSNKIQAYVWACIVKKSAIESIRFNEKIGMMEDTLWYLEVLSKINSISFYNGVLYNYQIITNSASHNKDKSIRNINNVFMIKRILDSSFFEDNKEYKMLYSTNFLTIINENIHNYINFEKNKNILKKYLKNISNQNDFKDLYDNSNLELIRIDRKIEMKLLYKKNINLLILFSKLKEVMKGINK